jgi:uncharacterized protein (TIGR02145 family)
MKNALIMSALLSLQLSPGYAQDSVHVKTGWNIIGAVKTGAVPEVLSTIPDSLITSSYFGYTPGVGYESTDTLDNGIGYWVKAKADGLIIFNNAPPVDSCKSKAFIYQGKLYSTVKIGDQCWMSENLDVGTMVVGGAFQTDNSTLEKYCYEDDPLNCALYGGLYQWDEAMQYVTTPGAQGVCPAGWHIPAHSEQQSLSSVVGGDGNALKAGGQGTGAGAGTNTSGFSALLAGRWYYGDGSFSNLGGVAYLWSSTESDASDADALYLSDANGDIGFYTLTSKDYGYSVRCIEN